MKKKQNKYLGGTTMRQLPALPLKHNCAIFKNTILIFALCITIGNLPMDRQTPL